MSSVESRGPSRETGRPGLIVLGGPSRAASTSLFELLAGHARVATSSVKEFRFYLPPQAPHASAARYPAPRDEFLAGFPPVRAGVWLLDATPDYLHYPESAARIADHFPSARVVFLLRDPVERFLSWHRYAHQRGRAEASGGLRAFHAAQLDPRREPGAPTHLLALAHGDYAAGLDAFLAALEHVHVAFFEELVRDPARVVAGIGRFLDLELDAARLTHRNGSRAPRSTWLAARERELKGVLRSVPAPGRLRRAAAPLRRLAGRVYRRCNTARIPTAGESNAEADAELLDRLRTHYAPSVTRLGALLGGEPPWPRWRGGEPSVSVSSSGGPDPER